MLSLQFKSSLMFFYFMKALEKKKLCLHSYGGQINVFAFRLREIFGSRRSHILKTKRNDLNMFNDQENYIYIL